MVQGPWFVTPTAVRRYMEFTGATAGPGEDAEAVFRRAQQELLRVCAETWEHYRTTGRPPQETRTGAWAYRTSHTYGRLRLIVAAQTDPRLSLNPVVDIGRAYAGQIVRPAWQIWSAARSQRL